MLGDMLALAILVSVAALLFARWEYRKRGRLTLMGLFLLCGMFFLQNLVLEYATSYEIPSTVVDYIGLFVAVAGITLCLAGIIPFRSVAKMMCQDVGVYTYLAGTEIQESIEIYSHPSPNPKISTRMATRAQSTPTTLVWRVTSFMSCTQKAMRKNQR